MQENQEFLFILSRLQGLLNYHTTISRYSWDVIGYEGYKKHKQAAERVKLYLERFTRMYSAALPERKRVPNSYLAGTSKPSSNFSKRVYRSATYEILAFKMLKQMDLNKKRGY